MTRSSTCPRNAFAALVLATVSLACEPGTLTIVADAGPASTRPNDIRAITTAHRAVTDVLQGQRLALVGGPAAATLAVIVVKKGELYSAQGPFPIRDDGTFYEFLVPRNGVDLLVVFLSAPPPSPLPPFVETPDELRLPNEVERRVVRLPVRP